MNGKASEKRTNPNPWIDFNGVISVMDDTQYQAYLHKQETLKQMSSPAVNPQQQIASLQAQVDDLTLLAADMIGGSQ